MREGYNLKTLGPRAAQLIVELNERRQPIFSLADVTEITGLSPSSARSLVANTEARGIVTRLKPGLYNLVPFERGRDTEHVSDPYLIARTLVGGADYFISHGSALELHRMVTQPQLAIVVSCAKRLRPQHIHGYEFRFVDVKPEDFFGLTEIWITPQEQVRISDPERTIIDGLDHPQYVGGVTEVAKGLWMKRDTLRVELMIDYALRLGVGAVIRRLGYLLEFYGLADAAALEPLRARLTPTYQRLDPLFPNEGRMLARWRIRLNVEPDELDIIRSS
ncbi:type IV toxin-antitoxin system AbiEi family antitoxin domain-containing protein (plasmid) [Rhizorhabdus wittichii]|uniref:Type IV toxin-antitoxin system AbiEi family antitoxin domain-containing protein n=1 Tax=Rhizorhabdus wittichii TaxID=160791 RepID=A0A975D8J0_9SPHN|nr:type IV toxin-antitoxin system AbiEi family antitoxin domain-containing protein [Rhizorhabdus wittichii]QTH24936.1 type IV toxin-antitoxin system AbiEi family antitoxin domain-containing protein [Rhizorhabdus wittichii]